MTVSVFIAPYRILSQLKKICDEGRDDVNDNSSETSYPSTLSRNEAVKELDFDRIYKIYRMENGMRLEIMAHCSVFAFGSANLSFSSCKSCQNIPFQLHGSG